MTVFVLIAELLIGLFLQPSGRISSLIYLLLIGGIGVAIYGGFSLRVRLMDRFIGSKAASLRRRFHIH
ncbi:Membrane protein involved in the export of O-antigen, teichoic acid lipoteichoic acid [Streptococcus sp. DD11]|nr:Membrane protein involved in the export of O-antigen, teichoic acid lipoteichoic acid [Streptococcus sp. DD11]